MEQDGGADSILSELDPDVEIVIPSDALDYAGVVFRGHQGVREALGALMDAWSETRFDPIDVIERGTKVLAICRQRSRGLHTELEVDQIVAHVWDVGKDGKFTRMELYFDPEQARERFSMDAP